MPLYATYDTTTASRVIRWRARGRYHVAAVFDPDPLLFTGPRPVALRKHGGKRHNPRDLSLGGNTTAQMFTDVLGAYVITYDCDPGGFWRGDAEEIDLELADESPESDALFAMLVRAHCADPWLVGTANTIDPDPSRWLLFGESSGAYDSARSQLVPVGGFGDLAQRESVRGGGRYKFDPDHTVGHLFLFIGQNRLSTFNEYVTEQELAATATGSLSGSASIAVSSGFPPTRAGVSIGYQLPDEQFPTYYTIASDFAGGAGSVAITPSLIEDLPAGTALITRPAETTYVAATSGASNQAGASVLRIVGDAIALRSANRLRVRCTSGATATGTNSTGENTLEVSSSFPPLRTGTYVYYDLGAGPVEFNVLADYAGGAGAVSIFPVLPANVPAGTALFIRFDMAVETDTAAPATFATAIDVPVWPPLCVDVANGSDVELGHFNYEDFRKMSWAYGYVASGNSGYEWRTIPFHVKREADVDFLLDGVDNPRPRTLNVCIAGPQGNTLWRIDSLTDPRSFLVRHAGAPRVLPERLDLHDPADMVLLAHKLDAAGARVVAYLGTREDNPGGTNLPAQPYLAGRNGSFSPTVLHDFITDPSSLGGAFH